MTREHNLDTEVQLALQIEANNPGSNWATELRRRLQEKNDRFSDMRLALQRIANGEHREAATDGQIVGGLMQIAQSALTGIAASVPSTEFAG